MTTEFDLPMRRGERPRTTPSNPHEQMNQNAPPALQEATWEAMRSLPLTHARPSQIAPTGSRALWAATDGAGPPADSHFMTGREFAHLHPPYDGSLHMVLEPSVANRAIEAGWAERHPLAGRFAPSSTVMVYGPRNDEELNVVTWLIRQSHHYATTTPLLGLRNVT